jgi:predicted DNA-binding transcriptional regulator YafY
MPVNKNAMLRYLTLDKCFANPGRKYFIEDLLNACNVALSEHGSDGISRRQLFEDIKFMESERGWLVPLERLKEGKKTYYRYSNSKFSINNSPLNKTEAEYLKSALSVLSRFKGTPQFSWIDELIPRIEHIFNLKNGEKIICFEENIYLKGIGFLEPLFNAIINKIPQKIRYKSFKKDNESITVLHPYFLKQFNQRWYVFGKSENYNNISVRSLDRIIEIKDANVPYIENYDYDFEEYFEDIIGINRGKNSKTELITLHFLPQKSPYIKTKPLHGSQKMIKED